MPKGYTRNGLPYTSVTPQIASCWPNAVKYLFKQLTALGHRFAATPTKREICLAVS
ncbi:hypothetical protein COO91_02080 [Nostoc flagelliforme CCNUN1]|uniref:Transposase n=1 Tax=Nostoc flagelliforme CCNUN1 TaxID=2038116 RepID=A0A2K8SL61_9NOSO|nr:hypothetical protein COO91_02080 [Nostoc flagelliforme CCNUN1]